MKRIKIYLVNVAMAINQFINTLAGGHPDECISSRFGRRWPDSWFARFIDHLFFFDKDHTENAIEFDEGSRDVAPDNSQTIVAILIIVIVLYIISRLAC